MSKKSEQTAHLLELIQPPQGIPDPPDSGTLLERGLVLVLLRALPAARANAAVDALRKAYEDWNEARVAQAQEVATYMAPRSAKQSAAARASKYVPAAREVKAYLQEVFQKTHGLDLEFLRSDPAGGAKMLAQMPMLGTYLGSLLLWIATDGEQPITLGHIRVLDRLGLITRTTSIKKAREAVAPLFDKKDGLRFSVSFGYIADAWCDSRKPVCWECQLRDECPTGKKVYKDWKTQQERLSAQRAREHSRRLAQEARDHARAKREAAREQKKAEAEQARRKKAAAREQKKSEAARKKTASAKSKSGAKKAGSGASKAKTKSKAKTSAKPKAKTGSRSKASATGSRATATSKARKKAAKSTTRKTGAKGVTRKKTARR